MSSLTKRLDQILRRIRPRDRTFVVTVPTKLTRVEGCIESIATITTEVRTEVENLLIAAGLYQATPLKRVCLQNCRSPMPFLMRFWRPAWAGAARLGLTHGIYCLGCCALLMALLFVFGVMNLVWVAALALFVLSEKVLRFGPQIGAAAAVVSALVGLVMVVGVRLPA